MPRKSIQPIPLKSKIFSSPKEIDLAIEKLHRRIGDIEALGGNQLIDEADVYNTRDTVRASLLDIFGAESAEFDRYQYFEIWDGQMYVNMDDHYMQQCYRAGITTAKKTLESLIKRLEEKKADMTAADQQPFWHSGQVQQQKRLVAGHRVFIVHGHDEAAKQSVARCIEKLELEAVILHEQPDLGKTVIEKLEHNAENIGFAVILLTPDDEGYPVAKPQSPQKRARQNVIFELGFFIAKLGRERVCVLYKEGVELPSDYNGVLYVPIDADDSWKLKLAKNIHHSGIVVDLNKLL